MALERCSASRGMWIIARWVVMVSRTTLRVVAGFIKRTLRRERHYSWAVAVENTLGADLRQWDYRLLLQGSSLSIRHVMKTRDKVKENT